MFAEIVSRALIASPDNPFLPPGAVIFYYLICWAVIGRKRNQPAIVTCYEPPDGLSPAGMSCALAARMAAPWLRQLRTWQLWDASGLRRHSRAHIA